MDLKMHVYSVPLRSPFAFPRVPWYFEVGNASDQKLEVGNCVPPRPITL